MSSRLKSSERNGKENPPRAPSHGPESDSGVAVTGARPDHLSRSRRSQVMAAIRRRDTSPELTLRRALWRSGIRGWRVDSARLPGRPDLVFFRYRVAVFVDGRLWHGHPSKYPARLNPVWLEKIRRNVERDRSVDAHLRLLGWRVVRIWDSELGRDPDAAVARVVRELAEATPSSGSGRQSTSHGRG